MYVFAYIRFNAKLINEIITGLGSTRGLRRLKIDSRTWQFLFFLVDWQPYMAIFLLLLSTAVHGLIFFVDRLPYMAIFFIFCRSTAVHGIFFFEYRQPYIAKKFWKVSALAYLVNKLALALTFPDFLVTSGNEIRLLYAHHGYSAPIWTGGDCEGSWPVCQVAWRPGGMGAAAASSEFRQLLLESPLCSKFI